MEKTLVFCTAYVPPGSSDVEPAKNQTYYSWDVRYRIWLESIRRSMLVYHQILIIDDGSATSPDWPDLHIVREGEALQSDAPIVLFQFRDRLGRAAVSDFPGWVRSFFFAGRYATANNFARIVHIEADAFLITEAAIQTVNRAPDGWTALWSDRYDRPESAVQIIAGEGLRTFCEYAEQPVSNLSGVVIETALPFTRIEKGLACGRYGEDILNWVPQTADCCMQAHPTRLGDYASYFWWMPWFSTVFPQLSRPLGSSLLKQMERDKLILVGHYYLFVIEYFSRMLSPHLYFEIGTHTGSSLQMVKSDAVCVDPEFKIKSDVLLNRPVTQFFQTTSDAFFEQTSVVQRAMPYGLGLAFLDGLHLFENLLRDFINAEKYSNPSSVILLHDCLPFNERMARREWQFGGDEEPEESRFFWTGDVWKLMLVFKKYRPELSVLYLDCPPTGLVSCSNLNKQSTVLHDHYDAILAEFSQLTIQVYGFERLWTLFPTVDTYALLSEQSKDRLDI